MTEPQSEENCTISLMQSPAAPDRTSKFRLSRLLLILNCGALVWYFAISAGFAYLQDLPVYLYSSPDSRGYLEIAQWLGSLQGEPPGATQARPLLYPLILSLIRSVSLSPYAVWAVQSIFWLLTVNLTGLAVYQANPKQGRLIFAFLVTASNISFLTLTFFALTEVAATFLLALLVFIVMRKSVLNLGRRQIFSIVLVLSSLTVLRPAFKFHLLIVVILLIVQHRQDLTGLAVIGLACLPVLGQTVFMKRAHGEYMLSRIGTTTLQEYYLSKLYSFESAGKVTSVSEYEAGLAQVKGFSGKQAITYAVSTFPRSGWVFLENIVWQNMLNASTFVRSHPILAFYSQATNWLYLLIHILIVPIIVKGLWAADKDNRLKIVLLYGAFLMILGFAGISFWQGDRLIVPSLPLWLGTYSLAATLWLGSWRGAKSPH